MIIPDLLATTKLLGGAGAPPAPPVVTPLDKMATSESETVDDLSNFFSDIVKKFEIPKFDSNDLVTENIKDPVFTLAFLQ